MKNAIRFLMLAALLMSACEGRKSNASTSPQPTTQTIAPAAAKPSPTGTDVTTQTVDIENSRSEEDGGVAATKTSAKKKGRK